MHALWRTQHEPEAARQRWMEKHGTTMATLHHGGYIWGDKAHVGYQVGCVVFVRDARVNAWNRRKQLNPNNQQR